MRINILAPDNGAGLSTDRKIISELLSKAGHEVILTDPRHSPIRNADLNIMLEILYPQAVRTAQRNFIIVNPEWFSRSWESHLRGIDAVICKTRDAQQIFSTLHRNVVFTSFTSPDLFDGNIGREMEFAHFAGQSSAKGTLETIAAFTGPEMPQLTIYLSPKSTVFSEAQKAVKQAGNITLIAGRIDDTDFKQAFNRARFHLCASHYEGFGHYINEARSVGACIFTTNAAPMNELVRPEYAFGCPVGESYHFNMAISKKPNPAELKKLIITACDLSEKEITYISAQARKAYLNNDAFFRREFMQLI